MSITAIQKQTTTKSTVTLTGANIIALLAQHIKSNQPDFTYESAEIFFKIPSGGDYSGMDLDFKNDACVQVIITSVKSNIVTL